MLDYNPTEELEPQQSLWIWGNTWMNQLEWDPRDWQWRRLGILPPTSVMNYTTKRGYRIALKQNTQQMPLDLELEREGYNSQTRAKFFNRIWHPYLPRKVSAMQWLVLTGGLPVGAWRAKIGLPHICELCPTEIMETLQHAFQDCPQMSRVWTLFRNTRQAVGLEPAYLSWKEISRGLIRDPPGPQLEEELRWDTASKVTLNTDTPWDILRAQLLWSIWCQRVAHSFREEIFHMGVVLWHAWRNTIYCAMEAYKELFRYKRNEEKRQEAINCFQQIWTAGNVFGRLHNNSIKWNLTPPSEFLPAELAAWTATPIRVSRLSPSPDVEAKFVARPDFTHLVDEFLRSVGEDWQPAATSPEIHRQQVNSPPPLFSPDNQLHHEAPTDAARRCPGEHTETEVQGEANREGVHCIPGKDQSEGEAENHSDPDVLKGQDLQSPHNRDSHAHPQVRLPSTKAQVALHSHRLSGRIPTLRSRPKQKCSPHLRHPSKLKQDSALRTTTPGQCDQDKTTSPPRNKPKSRPKRKCRNGPRTRRLQQERHVRAESQQPTPPPPPPLPQDSQIEHEPPRTEKHPTQTWTHTDRVTFQPSTSHRCSYFDKYKKKNRCAQGPVVSNSYSAKKLGISEQEFEASLTEEINDLLTEIDNQRREALEPSRLERESNLLWYYGIL